MAGHKRAPNGYRIKLWADGFYHVYKGGDCIAEELTLKAAIYAAMTDKVNRGGGSIEQIEPAPAGGEARP